MVSNPKKSKVWARKTKGDIVFDCVNTFLIILITAVMIYPFLYIVSVSITPYEKVPYVKLFPLGFSFDVYKYIFALPSVRSGYLNSLFYTVAGTLFSLILTIFTAYPLSKSWLPFRKVIVIFIIITMYFGGGLIALFLVLNSYGLYNTRMVILVSSGISTYNVMVMNSFFKGLPHELEEAAYVDGANELTILLKVILPLSKPILATISLFYAVGQWNSWFNHYIFLDDSSKYPIQLILRNMMISSGSGIDPSDASVALQKVGAEAKNINNTSLNYALTVAIVAPILCVYPFVQKYFVKGVLVGSLKG